MLADYNARAQRGSVGVQPPMLPGETFAWQQRYMETGTMPE